MSDIQVEFIECFFGKDEVDYDGIEKSIQKGYNPNELVGDLISSMSTIDYSQVMTSMRFVKLLLENGLDVNKPHFNRNKYSYYSFASICIIYGTLEVIEHVIRAGAEINKIITGPGFSVSSFAPIHLCDYTLGDKKQIYSLLQRSGADFTIEDSFGDTVTNQSV